MTGQTPAKLLLQREMRTKIPTIQPTKVQDGSRIDSEVRNKDSSEKTKAKEYTDKTRHAKTRKLAVGDEVLVTLKRKKQVFHTVWKRSNENHKDQWFPNYIRGSSW
jgi:alpha-tubulin suppressor-like RCC1 family protein